MRVTQFSSMISPLDGRVQGYTRECLIECKPQGKQGPIRKELIPLNFAICEVRTPARHGKTNEAQDLSDADEGLREIHEEVHAYTRLQPD
jgi:hypothetical protein